MIIVLKPGATQAEIDHVVEKIQAAGCTPHLSRGVERTIIGAIGDESVLRQLTREELEALAAAGVIVVFLGSILSIWAARGYLRLPPSGYTLKLYRNLGDGSFQDVTRQVGLDKVLMVMGANFGDIDNDGYLDLYLGTGNPSYASLVPSLLLRNKGGQSFVDVTASSGTGELHKGHGVAFADIDQDGDEEIVFEVGGATPGDAHGLRLFENPGRGNDWIALKLVGVKTNRAAIGARIAVSVEGAHGRHVLHRTVSSGGSFGASPLLQHIGLGESAGTVDVDIWWPTSNTRQRYSNVGKNQFLEITEFAQAPTHLNRPRLPLGGASR